MNDKKTWGERLRILDEGTDKTLSWVIKSRYSAFILSFIFIAGWFARYFYDEVFHICGNAIL